MSAAVEHVTREGHHDDWEGSLTLLQARTEYFRFNRFGEDGGYADKWVDFKLGSIPFLGPIPFPFPNSPARVRALKYHDLHHVMTGYQTDFPGELEISAWEIGGGCADMIAAWILNLGGLAAGMLFMPGRIFAAFVRGRRSKNLYRHAYDDALLARSVGDVRGELGLDREVGPATLGDRLAVLAWFALGLVTGLTLFAILLPLAPIGWLLGHAFKPRT